MHLPGNDEVVRVNPGGPRYACSVFLHGRGIVTDVVAKIQFVVRGEAHTAGAGREKSVDTEGEKCREGVDRDTFALFGQKV